MCSTLQLPARRGPRGVALLEVMVALTILAIGLVGTMRLQILGVTANGGARATTSAGQLATELAAALERVEFDDARISGAAGASAPSPFGRLVGSSTSASHVHTWADSMATATPPMIGVRLDASLPRDPYDSTRPQYVRRWSVWDYMTATPNGQAAAKVIAVSVIYKERGNPIERETVVLTHKPNAGLALSLVAGYR